VSALLSEPLQVSRRTAFVRRTRSPVDEETLQQKRQPVYHRTPGDLAACHPVTLRASKRLAPQANLFAYQ
jgi:hypothetical protein